LAESLQKFLVTLWVLISFLGCVSGSKQDTVRDAGIQIGNDHEMESMAGYHKVFPYPYEVVWRATQLTLKYPIRINNMETGILETEFINSTEGFQAPAYMEHPALPSSSRHRMVFQLVKISGKESTKVVVVKKN
jgi:hypothetical protein